MCQFTYGMVEGSRGLFNKAILMSGSPLTKESLFSDQNYAFKLAEKLGFHGKSESEILGFLEQADVLAMAEAQYTLIQRNGNYYAPLPFGPCIESYSTDSSFMLEAPIDLLGKAWSNSMDIMIGGTSGEGICDKSEFEENPHYDSMIPAEIRLNVNDDKLKEFVSRLRDFYLKISSSEFEAYQKVLRFMFIFISFHGCFSSKETNFVG